MRRRQDGFTIVELMIATAVFSLVLLLCSFAIIHVGRMYYKGMITNRTQDVSRKVIDDITRAIQFGNAGDDFLRTGSGTFPNAGTVQVLCLGNVRYSFTTERYLGGLSSTSLPHVLWKDRIPIGSDCDPLDISQENPGGNEGVELLGENMRVPELTVTEGSPLWDVSVRIAYGDDEDLFEDGDSFGICKGTAAGGQFCAVSAFKTAVAKRL